MIKPAQLLWFLLLGIQGATGENVLVHISHSLTAFAGEKFFMHCTRNLDTGSCAQWFQQKPGTAPLCISCNANGASNEFTANSSGNDFTLKITNVDPEDDPAYYCMLCLSSPPIFGRGTRVQIKREAAAPSVFIYPPLQDKLEMRKASLVCTFPGDGSVIWKADGKVITKDVINSKQMLGTEQKFRVISMLTVLEKDWLSPKSYSCEFMDKALPSPLIKTFYRKEWS